MNKYYVILEFALLTAIMINSNCDSINKSEVAIKNGEKPEVPHINSVAMGEVQPYENDTNVIWYDNFNKEKPYLESRGEIDTKEFFGTAGGSMKAGFKKGDVDGEGNRKLAFGDFPDGSPVVKKGKKFDEVYWRIYVKHEHGWEGSPMKMSRATSIVSAVWQQAMIAHVWSGDKNSLTLDPARGVDGQSDRIKTTRYNDFDNLAWLGGRPASEFQISSAEESGYWILVEATAKLNTPGQNDGSCRLWIDGRLEAERKNLNFRGSYIKHGINAIFLESYWNDGAVKTEGRWYDNFVISTRPIGPVTCPANPTLYKTPYHGPENIEVWEVELATDYNGNDVVFNSLVLGGEESIVITSNNGTFDGSLKGRSQLSSKNTYFCRVRQKSTNGRWSDWSRWHQPFNVCTH